MYYRNNVGNNVITEMLLVWFSISEFIDTSANLVVSVK